MIDTLMPYALHISPLAIAAAAVLALAVATAYLARMDGGSAPPAGRPDTQRTEVTTARLRRRRICDLHPGWHVREPPQQAAAAPAGSDPLWNERLQGGAPSSSWLVAPDGTPPWQTSEDDSSAELFTARWIGGRRTVPMCEIAALPPQQHSFAAPQPFASSHRHDDFVSEGVRAATLSVHNAESSAARADGQERIAPFANSGGWARGGVLVASQWLAPLVIVAREVSPASIAAMIADAMGGSRTRCASGDCIAFELAPLRPDAAAAAADGRVTDACNDTTVLAVAIDGIVRHRLRRWWAPPPDAALPFLPSTLRAIDAATGTIALTVSAPSAHCLIPCTARSEPDDWRPRQRGPGGCPRRTITAQLAWCDEDSQCLFESASSVSLVASPVAIRDDFAPSIVQTHIIDFRLVVIGFPAPRRTDRQASSTESNEEAAPALDDDDDDHFHTPQRIAEFVGSHVHSTAQSPRADGRDEINFVVVYLVCFGCVARLFVVMGRSLSEVGDRWWWHWLHAPLTSFEAYQWG